MLLYMDGSFTVETLIRLTCFTGVFVVVAAFEASYPRRLRSLPRRRRWPANLGLSVVNQVLTRLLLPVSAIALALHAQEQGWGLLAVSEMPAWLAFVLAIVLLDLTIYLQHRLYHVVPLLWRLHRVHHADVDFDISTGIRFHPLSILLSALIKLAAVAVIGPAPVAVLVFEVVLNATSLFNHSNLRIPPGVDRVLRLVLVTPDMHRVHHSADPDETNRNFGFNFPWWDRLFRSYCAQPRLGHTDMRVGLPEFREADELRLDRLLSQPFRNQGH